MGGGMRFEWDKAKSRANQKKHGVSFEEAQSVFFEDHAILFDDPDHSREEKRFLLLGASAALRILIVVHCYHEEEEVVRIISARQATQREQDAFGAVRKKP
jgi:uncharacterized protein